MYNIYVNMVMFYMVYNLVECLKLQGYRTCEMLKPATRANVNVECFVNGQPAGPNDYFVTEVELSLQVGNFESFFS